jgi:hypothetical protein
MIEIIRTFTGEPRPNGQAKITEAPMFRCTTCGNIKPSFKELKTEGCTKHEHRASIQK